MKLFDMAVSAFYKTANWACDHSDELLLAAGGVLGVAGVVTACINSDGVRDVIADIRAEREELKEEIDELVPETEDMTAKDKLDRFKMTVLNDGECVGKCAKELGRRYTLPALLLVMSGGCVLASHHIVKGREMAAVAAYNILNADFQNYRKNVISSSESNGEIADKVFKTGAEAKLVESTDANGETFKEIEFNGGKLSGYAVMFDNKNRNWKDDPEMNEYFIDMTIKQLNTLAPIHGKRVTLNKVYDALGYEDTEFTEAGQVVGWDFSKDTEGDGEIRVTKIPIGPHGRDGFILDFNVDGIITHKMKKTTNLADKLAELEAIEMATAEVAKQDMLEAEVTA